MKFFKYVMQRFSKKYIIVLVTAGIILASSWFWYVLNKTSEKVESVPVVGNNSDQVVEDQTQQKQENEIESIKDLIDGEYVFDPIDTSNWKTYRNEEAGFEMKIPKNWYVNDLSKSKIDSVAKYYNGEEQSGVCFGEKGKKYFIEGGQEDALCLYVHKDENILESSKYREFTLKRKKGYDGHVFLTTVDGYAAIVQDGFGLETYIFRDNDYWVLSHIVGDLKIISLYPNILQSIKFIQ